MSVSNGLKKMKAALSRVDEKINPIKIDESTLDFEVQMLTDLFLSEINNASIAQNVSRKDLAKRVNTSPSYITQLMKGNRLPNLKILTAMGLALEKKFNIIAVDDIEQTRTETSVKARDNWYQYPFKGLSKDTMEDNLFDDLEFVKSDNEVAPFFERDFKVELPQIKLRRAI